MEPQGDDGEEVTRLGLMDMVADEGGPGLTTVARQVGRSILGDGSRRHLVAKLAKLPGDSVLAPEGIFLPIPPNHGPQVSIGWRSTNRPSGLSPPEQSPKGTMPADDGFGAQDDDRVEHRAEDASGESEQHAVSRMNSGLWHGTTQDDDLLAKDGVFDKEGGAGSEGRTQRAHDGFEDFDEHRGERPSTGRSADKSWRKLRPVRLGTEFLRHTGGSAGRRGTQGRGTGLPVVPTRLECGGHYTTKIPLLVGLYLVQSLHVARSPHFKLTEAKNVAASPDAILLSKTRARVSSPRHVWPPRRPLAC